MLLDIFTQSIGVRPATRRKGRVSTGKRNLHEPEQRFIKKKSQPYTFALAGFSHQVHAVVPVAGTDQRQTVNAKLEAIQDGPNAVLIQCALFSGRAGRTVIGIFFRAYGAAFDEGDWLIEDTRIARAD